MQVPDLDAIVVPVSGGGMISGIAIAAKGLNPGIRIIAAEPIGVDLISMGWHACIYSCCSAPLLMGCSAHSAGRNNAADVAACKAAGALVPCEQPQTIADGLRAPLGSLTWPIVRDLVDDVVTVSECEIVAAMRLCFERMKVTPPLPCFPALY